MIKTISILGCGWLGLPLGQQLAQEGYSVKGSTTNSGKIDVLEKAGIHPYLLSVSDRLEGQPLDFFRTDLLVLNIPPGRRRPDVEQRHPNQVKIILDKASESTTKYLLLISSTSVYGKAIGLVTETDQPTPHTASGRALVAAENLLLQSHQSLHATILRLAGLFGPQRNPARFLAGKKNLANANAPVNLVHLQDCIAVIKAIIQQGKWNEIYNVCADEHPARSHYYVQKALEFGLEPPTFLEDTSSNGKIISNEKVKTGLGIRFRALS